MKRLITVLLSLTFYCFCFAQTEAFDIATFTAPKEWQRKDSNGVLLFYNYKTVNDQTSFCQIFLFASNLSKNTAKKNFQTEWYSKVAKPYGAKENPKTQIERTPDGWTIITGTVTISTKGVTYTTILVTASGFSKVMSVLINIAGEEYVKDADTFLEKMNLNTNGIVDNTTKNKQGAAAFSNYFFSIPTGWNSQQYPDGIVLSSPVSNTGEKCNITLWPTRTAGNNLQNDAVIFFNTVFKTFQTTTSSTPNSIIKGISGQGWEYYIIKSAIKIAGGDYQTQFGFVFVAKLGNQLAAISGISKDPLVSSCFGLQLTNVWPAFFYSLQFKNWNIIAQAQLLQKKLAGKWMAVTGSSGDRFVFAPNGRYASASAAQRYYLLSTTELLKVTDFSFGDGSYSLAANNITFLKDDEKNKPAIGLFRIEQESNNSGKTWTEKLYLLRKSVVDGSNYEVIYERQNN